MKIPEVIMWQHAILISDLPSTTRLILLSLSCHMTSVGESCFPSLSQIAKETGLGRNTVSRHLMWASDVGWLDVEKTQNPNGTWTHNKYYPKCPKTMFGGSSTAEPYSSGEVQGVAPQKDSNKSVSKSVNRSNGRFTPPTQKEVEEYVKEKGYSVDSERFVNFYESKGWMVGKSKMVSWRHAVANWAKSNGKSEKPDPYRHIDKDPEGYYPDGRRREGV